MKQLTFLAPGSLEWRDVPDPKITSPREAIVRPISVASCDIDGAAIRGLAPIPGPYPFGHECVAQVVEVGVGVEVPKPGDNVICPFQISCGDCDRCRRGLTGSCQSVPQGSAYGLGPLGGTSWGGTLSNYVLVPYADAMLVKVHAGSERLASLADNVPDGARAVAPHLEARPGSPVIVLGGAGPSSVPLYAAAVAVAMESSQVDYVDFDAGRLEIAKSVGANPVQIESGKYPKRFGKWPITVDSTNNVDGLHCAIRSTEPGGVCTSTSIFFGAGVPMPLLEMYTRGITFITGRVQARAGIESLLKLIEAGKLAPEKVTSETAHWDDAIDAFKSYTTKLLVTR
jgi:threonine dehydrogenase-like Zn-dependent dehydrogenase